MNHTLTLNEKINLRHNMKRFQSLNCAEGRKILMRMGDVDMIKIGVVRHGYRSFSDMVSSVLPAPAQLIA